MKLSSFLDDDRDRFIMGIGLLRGVCDSRIRENISMIERKWKERRRRLVELGATSLPNQEG